jgi:hypothetical protein
VAAHQQLLLPEMFIELDYTVSEPGLQEDAVASANDDTAFSQVGDVVSMEEKSGAKYATLEHGLWGLDGNYPYFNSPTDPGYVSERLSGTDCFFTVRPKIIISFSMLHTQLIPGISITWGSGFDEWAEEFKISAWVDSNLIAEKTVTDNHSPFIPVWINLSNYSRLEIEVIKWSQPYRRARCSHVYLAIRKVYNKMDLMSFEHSQSADLLSATLPKNAITFKLRNDDSRWNPDNPQNESMYLLNQQEIRLRYGMDINGQIEWIDGGVFWMDEWDTPNNGIEASFTARDGFTFMNQDYTGSLSGTLYEIAEAALQQANLPGLSSGAETYYLSPVLRDYTTDVDTGNGDKYSISAVLQMVAHAANCVLYQDRRGTIHIEPWNESFSGYMIDPFISYTHPEYSILKPLKEVSVGYGDNQRAVVPNHDTGEVQTIDNPLLIREADAIRVGKHAQEVLEKRKVISGEFRADVRLDCLDPIIVTSKYASNIIAITEVNYSTTGGAIRGKYTGRVTSIVLEPEVRYSGEYYSGEV